MQGITWRRPRECHFKEPRRIVVVLLPRGMATRAGTRLRSERKIGFESSARGFRSLRERSRSRSENRGSNVTERWSDRRDGFRVGGNESDKMIDPAET